MRFQNKGLRSIFKNLFLKIFTIIPVLLKQKNVLDKKTVILTGSGKRLVN